ncbi:MAG: GGDEF domain-containing protein [Candidatus Omnitrophica bacterium]|nr:GGDEF domain-containing protein [Candidatus Omnitrophota bacterium]
MFEKLNQEKKDFLTGLFLRESLYLFAEELINASIPAGDKFSIAVVDIDHFKRFNDNFGHDFGDKILKEAANILELVLSKDSRIFRYGGDEFVMVFPEKDIKEVVGLMRICLNNMRLHPFMHKNKKYKITFSCGIAAFPQDHNTIEGLIKKADKAMYFSKGRGRNYITVVGNIKYIILRNILISIVFAGIIFASIFLFRSRIFGEFVPSVMEQVKKIRVTTKPKNLDVVVLKNGVVLQGYILDDLTDRIVINLELDKGSGTVVFYKKDIEKIEYKKE